MLQFNLPNLIAGLLFSIIGMSALSYGRKLKLWKPSVIGAVLMLYPYVVWNIWLLWIIGCGLLVTLWFHHDE
jgi:hypothetical protein